MSHPPHDSHLTPSAAPSPRLLPRRGMRTLTRGTPPVPAHAAGTSPQPVQATELEQRYDLLHRLGIPTRASEDFDDMARDMATQAGFLYGVVNLFLEEQTFVGLHQPPADSGHVIIGRTMSREHGWCPEVMARKKALPLYDVHASPRFSGNQVVDAVGIRSYFGAPLIHASGLVLGTVCIIDPEKRPLSEARRFRDITISTGVRVMDHMTRAPAR